MKRFIVVGAALLACVHAKPAPKRNIDVMVRDGDAGGIWTFYGLMQLGGAGDVHSAPAGRVTLSFDAEVKARSATAGYYDDKRKKNPTLQRVYAAQDEAQERAYAALPGPQPVEVIEPTWANALYLKEWALSELKRTPEARQALEAAVALSPLNAQYLSELAYTWQADRDCDKALPLFTKAADAAQQLKSGAVLLGRAWRGQAYCLVEQGKWDDAEALYGKAIALDPRDEASKKELEYLQRNRKR
jgi:tetratricopeptide (TPR) repeat protein